MFCGICECPYNVYLFVLLLKLAPDLGNCAALVMALPQLSHCRASCCFLFFLSSIVLAFSQSISRLWRCAFCPLSAP